MGQTSVWDNLGVWLIGLVSRWLFKIASGVFITLGIQQPQFEMWIGAILTFVIGALISKYQNKYLKNLDPKK